MIPGWFPVVITIGVVVMALAMVLQCATLLGIYLAIRRLQEKIEQLIDRQIQPILTSAGSILEQTRKEVEELSGALRVQVAKVDQVITEATDRARLQVIRADELMADTLERVERTVDYVEENVLRPVREVRAVMHGIGSAVEHLRSRRGRRNGPERATQDEEMFI